MELFYKTAAINYSTYSEGAEQKAKESGLDYEGHNRIVSMNVEGSLTGLIEGLQRVQALERVGEEVLLHQVIMNANEPLEPAAPEAPADVEAGVEDEIVEFALA